MARPRNTPTRQARKLQPFISNLAGNVTTSVLASGGWGFNTIQLLHADGRDFTSYPATNDGLDAATAAATANDAIVVPQNALITGSHTLAGCEYRFHPDLAMNTTFTVVNGTHLIWCKIAKTANDANDIYGIILPATGSKAYMTQCSITVTQSGSGGAYAIYGASGGLVECYECHLNGASISGSGYGAYTTNGAIYLWGGRAEGSTARACGVVSVALNDIYSLQADCTGLSLWNGSSNDSVPAGWSEYTFDDSAWVTPDIVTTVPSYARISGADPLWVNPQSVSGKQVLIRQEFTLAEVPAGNSTLFYWWDDLLKGMYINGTQVVNEIGGARSGWGYPGGPFSVAIAPELLRVGVNVIGYYGQEAQSPGTEWGTWKLVYSATATEGNVYPHAVEGLVADGEIPMEGDRAVYDAADYPERHTNDTDSGTASLHHTLGTGANQAAAGDHAHTTVPDHDHSGDAGDGAAFDAANLGSGAATDGYVLTADGAGGAAWEEAAGGPGAVTQVAMFAVTGDLTVSDDPLRVYNVYGTNKTISKVFLAAGSAPTGAAVIVDIHKSGTTIFTTQGNRPQIADGANTGQSTTIESATWADGEYLTAHIDQVGSTTPGSDLTVHVVYS